MALEPWRGSNIVSERIALEKQKLLTNVGIVLSLRRPHIRLVPDMRPNAYRCRCRKPAMCSHGFRSAFVPSLAKSPQDKQGKGDDKNDQQEEKQKEKKKPFTPQTAVIPVVQCGKFGCHQQLQMSTDEPATHTFTFVL